MPEDQTTLTLDQLSLYPQGGRQSEILRQLTPEPRIQLPDFGIDVRPCFTTDVPERVIKWLNVEVKSVQELVTCVKLLQVVYGKIDYMTQAWNEAWRYSRPWVGVAPTFDETSIKVWLEARMPHTRVECVRRDDDPEEELHLYVSCVILDGDVMFFRGSVELESLPYVIGTDEWLLKCRQVVDEYEEIESQVVALRSLKGPMAAWRDATAEARGEDLADIRRDERVSACVVQ